MTRSKEQADLQTFIFWSKAGSTSQHNLYEPKIGGSEGMGGWVAWREANFSVKHAPCEVIVTVGAFRSRFFDKKELEEDFNRVVSAVETAASESSFKLKES